MKIMKRIVNCCLLMGFGVLLAESGLPERSEIDEKYLWKLEDIYPSADAWEADYEYVNLKLKDVSFYKNTEFNEPEILLDCLQLLDEINLHLEKLEVYAYLLLDEDMRIPENQALADRIADLSVRSKETMSFFVPKIQAMPVKHLRKFFKKSKELAIYSQLFDNMTRTRDHILSPELEELLAMAGSMSGSPDKIYRHLTSTEMEYPQFRNEDGEWIQLSEGRYYQALLSQDQEVRRSAFKAMFSSFEAIQNTNAAVFDAMIRKNMFYARARNFGSTREASMFADNVPLAVYDNLIEIVSSNLEPLNRYMALRKHVAKLEELHLYDTYFPILPTSENDISYDQASKMLKEAFLPLGRQYADVIRQALDNRWIDVYETEGKSTGAYSWGAYDAHPYILMNYMNTHSDVFTLAHELGHSVHTWLTNQNQPFINAEYTLFVAEVASTFNENLLMFYLMQNEPDTRKKVAILDQWISNIIGTVYVQVMFADFERDVNRMAEEGIPLTAQMLNNSYMAALTRYFGESLLLDDAYQYNWGRIPHFYDGFYVYKYATSFCASAALSKAVLAEEPGARNAYLEFLKSGRSDYSIELLKKAGVDLTQKEPVLTTIQYLDDQVSELERLLSELGY